MADSNGNSKTASKLIAALLGAVIALQSVFIGLLISHIQDRSIHSDQQSVSLAAYTADREHFQRSLEEIKATLRDIQKRLAQTRAGAGLPSSDRAQLREKSIVTGDLVCQ